MAHKIQVDLELPIKERLSKLKFEQYSLKGQRGSQGLLWPNEKLATVHKNPCKCSTERQFLSSKKNPIKLSPRQGTLLRLNLD